MNNFYKRVEGRIEDLYQHYSFNKKINPQVWQKQQSYIDEAKQLSTSYGNYHYLESEIVKSGAFLRQQALSTFENKFNKSNLSVVIQVPPEFISPGGYSLFNNLVEVFNFLGIKCYPMGWEEKISVVFENFKPNLFLSSDNKIYLDRIDWKYIEKYRLTHTLQVGLTASLEEYGNSPLLPRLNWAKDKVDFYYSFRPQEYINARSEYRPYDDFGFKIFSIEFGANPLTYYPVNVPIKDIDYIFLGSNTRDKYTRFRSYLTDVFRYPSGLIIGPGWGSPVSWVEKDLHRFLYSRAKVGLNLHGANQTGWPSELNERTYILAAMGIPQLVDNVDLLSQRFSSDAVFAADSPREYLEIFRYLLAYPKSGEEKALHALNEVYSNHTTFHRLENLLIDIKKYGKTNIIL